MDSSRTREQLLDAAEALFYERGYQAVGMDALREASGVPLKRIYGLFPGKDAIALAMLDRRDARWHAALDAAVAREPRAALRVAAAFDWLAGWLASEGTRGCAWINAFGELGGVSPDIAAAVRRHKSRLRSTVAGIVADAGAEPWVADAVFLLFEGCMVTSGIDGATTSVGPAKQAAERLLRA